jgi:hypothetical protein
MTDAVGLFDTIFQVPDIHKGSYAVKVNDGVTTMEFRLVVEGEAPVAPNLLMPTADSTTKQPVHFTWESISDPSGVTYELQISTDPAFGKLLLDKTDLTSPEYTMTEAEKLELSGNERIIYWRVRAVDGIGNLGAWSAIRNFSISPIWPSWVIYVGYGSGIGLIVALGLWLRHRISNRSNSHSNVS